MRFLSIFLLTFLIYGNAFSFDGLGRQLYSYNDGKFIVKYTNLPNQKKILKEIKKYNITQFSKVTPRKAKSKLTDIQIAEMIGGEGKCYSIFRFELKDFNFNWDKKLKKWLINDQTLPLELPSDEYVCEARYITANKYVLFSVRIFRGENDTETFMYSYNRNSKKIKLLKKSINEYFHIYGATEDGKLFFIQETQPYIIEIKPDQLFNSNKV